MHFLSPECNKRKRTVPPKIPEKPKFKKSSPGKLVIVCQSNYVCCHEMLCLCKGCDDKENLPPPPIPPKKSRSLPGAGE